LVLIILTAFFFLYFGLYDSKREHSQMTSFLRKFIVGQAERERERETTNGREKEKRDPLFLILMSTLISSTLEVQERYSLIVKDISRSLSSPLLLLLILLSYIVLFSMLLPPFGQSAMRKEKKRNNFKLPFEHAYTYICIYALALFCSLFPPSSSSSSPPS